MSLNKISRPLSLELYSKVFHLTGTAGTFNCRSKSRPHPKQLNKPAFPTALTDWNYLRVDQMNNIRDVNCI